VYGHHQTHLGGEKRVYFCTACNNNYVHTNVGGGYLESRKEIKFSVTFLSHVFLQENQGYPESRKTINSEVSLLCGKSP